MNSFIFFNYFNIATLKQTNCTMTKKKFKAQLSFSALSMKYLSINQEHLFPNCCSQYLLTTYFQTGTRFSLQNTYCTGTHQYLFYKERQTAQLTSTTWVTQDTKEYTLERNYKTQKQSLLSKTLFTTYIPLALATILAGS